MSYEQPRIASLLLALWMATAAPDSRASESGTTTRGVEIGLTASNDVLAVVDGGLETGSFFPGLIESSIAFDLGHLLGWHNAEVYLRGLAMHGADPATATGSLNAPSNIANSVPTVRLFEAWLEQHYFEESLSVRLGLYAVDGEFDVKESAAVFMNGGFGTGVDLAQSGQNGPCVYPTSCLGLRLRYRPTRNVYLQAAVLDGVAGDPDDPFGTSVRLDHDSDGVFTIGEMGYQRGSEQGRFLRAALGAWHYSAPFDELQSLTAEGSTRPHHARPGVYALLEGGLYREPQDTAQGSSGFVRIGTADPHVHQVGMAISAGLTATGLFAGRDEDVTALGLSAAYNGSKFRVAQRASGVSVEDAEVVVELTHLLQVLPWLGVQFDAQYFVHPGTDPAVDHALLIGLRTRIEF